MRVLYKVDGAATVFVREASLPRFVPSISSPPLYKYRLILIRKMTGKEGIQQVKCYFATNRQPGNFRISKNVVTRGV